MENKAGTFTDRESQKDSILAKFDFDEPPKTFRAKKSKETEL